MRRINWKTVSTLVAMLVIMGCAERSVTSPSEAASSPASVMLAPADRPQLGLNGNGKDNASAEFTVSPWGGTYFIGNHAVVFPAFSICDPARSSYGAGTWDSPCQVSTSSVKIRAEVKTTVEGTWVDFTPSLRFAPSSSSAKWVWIFMYTPKVKDAKDLSQSTILYTQAIGARGVDESLEDPSQRTYVDTKSGVSMRRIKHFSGFTASSGRSDSTQTVIPGP